MLRPNRLRTVLAALLALVAPGVHARSLLSVDSQTAPPANRPAAAPELSVSYDLKLTISVPRLFGGPVVSAGSGVKAVFSMPASGFPRRASLARAPVAPYGIVKYNSDGGHFHVRHIVHGEQEPQLRASGNAVIEDWKGHYRRYGLAQGEFPKEWGPVTIWNRYEGQPLNAVSFAVRADGSVDPASAVNSTRELSDKEGWKTHAWPSFTKAAGLLGDSAFPGGDRNRVTGPGQTWPGADARGSLANLIRAAKAAVPAHASRVDDPPIPSAVPTWTIAARGSLWQLTATLPVTVLTKDAKLTSYRREILFDPATKTVRSDSVAVTFTMGKGLCEARFGWDANAGTGL